MKHRLSTAWPPRCAHRIAMCAAYLALTSPTGAYAQGAAAPVPIPLEPERWAATDSIRFESYLGRPALYINRGVALARDVELVDGVLEFSMAATQRTTFLGAIFHARAPDFSEVVFFRVGQSGSTEAVQYGPAFNSLGAAWQVYHGRGANAVADLARERWMRVRIELAGRMASVHLDGAPAPTLVIPRLAGAGGHGVGVWTGLFGRGAYFSDFAYTPGPKTADAAEPPLPEGTISDWQLSPVLDAEQLTPGTLPDLSVLQWEPVRAEPPGIVLINRYRVAPMASLPFDPATRIIDVDSVMGGRVRGSKVVLARAEIVVERDETRRLQFGYSDGITIYCNGRPLFFGVNAQSFRGDGVMTRVGDAVYLPLRRGRNEIVFAITEFTGGWAYWARLDSDRRGAGDPGTEIRETDR